MGGHPRGLYDTLRSIADTAARVNRAKVARQSRRSATTGPDAKACVQAAPRVTNTTAAPSPVCAVPPETLPPGLDAPATEAERLLGATMWLARFRDWLAEEIDLAPEPSGSRPATVTLRRAEAVTFLEGLGRAVALLDGLTIDDAQVRRRVGAAGAVPGGSTLQ